MKIKLTKSQVLDEILEDPNTIKIDEWATKHDCHQELYVAKIDDKFYRFTLEFSYNNGIQDFDYQEFIWAEEVRPVEVKTIKWEKVIDEIEK